MTRTFIQVPWRVMLAILELSFALFLGAGFLCFVAALWITALRLSLFISPLFRRYGALRARLDKFFGRG